jgi:hypothetical protein
LQFALLIGCLYNWYLYPDPLSDPYFRENKPPFFGKHDAEQFNWARNYWMPFVHGMLVGINFITGSPRIQLDGLKAFSSFAGMILQVILISDVCWLIWIMPQPFDWNTANKQLQGSMLWFEVELMTFLATFVSNVLFIALRTCMRHKIQLD